MTLAKAPSSENSENILNFAPWRLGAIKFLELTLSNILKGSFYAYSSRIASN
jgi:hypothetical protein